MSPQDTTRPLYVYLLAEAPKVLSGDFPARFQAIINRFKERYEQGSLVDYQWVLLYLYKELNTSQLMQDRCDLRSGIKNILQQLSTHPETQADVFIFLQTTPKREWQAPLNELAKRSDIGIHVFWLLDLNPQLNLADKTPLVAQQVQFRECLDQKACELYVENELVNRAVKAGWRPRLKEERAVGLSQAAAQPPEPASPPPAVTPAELKSPPAGESPSVSQPVSPPAEPVPHSLYIPQPPDRSDLAVPQPKKTVFINPSASEPSPGAPLDGETHAGSQPAPESPATANGERVKDSQPAEAAAEPAQEKQPSEAGEAIQQKVETEAATRQPAATEQQAPPPAPSPEPEPPVGKDGVASNWKNIEPPAGSEDPVDHTDSRLLDGGESWMMAAASRRGKMHAHQGIFREDAFGLGYAEGWNFVIVADGGGSRPLARVGSRRVAEAGIAAMVAEAHSLAKSNSSLEDICNYLLLHALHKAYDAIRQEAKKRERKIDDFGTTFLAVAHRPMDKQHLIGTLQVGDGLIAALFRDNPPVVLADPDVGEAASQTLFLTSKPPKEWLSRIKVEPREGELAMIACMCDGVSDDLIPYKTHLPNLFSHLSDMVSQAEPHKALLEFLTYEKRGSFDDRTLAVIYPRQSSPSNAPPAPEPEGKLRSHPISD